MKNLKAVLGREFKRFDAAVYESARHRQIDALPLLAALESSRAIALGVGSLLTLVRNQLEENGDGSPLAMSEIDELLGLCQASLDLLNSRIEAVADLAATRGSGD